MFSTIQDFAEAVISVVESLTPKGEERYSIAVELTHAAQRTGAVKPTWRTADNVARVFYHTPSGCEMFSGETEAVALAKFGAWLQRYYADLRRPETAAEVLADQTP